MRYSIIHHDVREEFGLTVIAYAICDSIHQLSHQNPTTKTDSEIAEFLGVDRSTVSKTKVILLEKGLIEDVGDGVKTTRKWTDAVVYKSGKNRTFGEKIPESGKKSPHTLYKEVKNTADAGKTNLIEEIVESSEEYSGDSKSPRVTGNKKKAYDELIAWSERERGFKFPKSTVSKQYRAFKLANTNGIQREHLIERWEEMESDKFWQRTGFDWMNVVQDLLKRPIV